MFIVLPRMGMSQAIMNPKFMTIYNGNLLNKPMVLGDPNGVTHKHMLIGSCSELLY